MTEAILLKFRKMSVTLTARQKSKQSPNLGPTQVKIQGLLFKSHVIHRGGLSER